MQNTTSLLPKARAFLRSNVLYIVAFVITGVLVWLGYDYFGKDFTGCLVGLLFLVFIVPVIIGQIRQGASKAGDAIVKTVDLDGMLKQSHERQGIAAYEAGDYTTALKHFTALTQIAPKYPEGHYYLGLAYSALNRQLEALRSYETALNISRAFPAAWNNRGSILTSLGDYREALMCFYVASSYGDLDGAKNVKLLEDAGIEMPPEYKDYENAPFVPRRQKINLQRIIGEAEQRQD